MNYYNKKIVPVVFICIMIATQAYASVKITIRPWKPVPPVKRKNYPGHLILKRKCLVHLNIIPENSAVFVDDVFRGKGWELTCQPRCLVLEPGQHLISVRKKGFIREEFIIHAKSHQRISIDIILNKGTINKNNPAHKTNIKVKDVYLNTTGTAVFRVVPDDAVLYIDNKLYGRVSKYAQEKNALKLKYGIHNLKIIRPGYKEYDTNFNVSEKYLKIFHLKLIKK